MSKLPEFEFVKTAACRDARVKNCPEIALNRPGVVALRDSNRPDIVVTYTATEWADLTAAIKAGEYDLSV
ncbi:DUF397 domain-containing protein [Streptomyces roseicoloratus]|uniref:DUF397 domain-containing protein n=1 Tax=Streptomyces roseicoloratus TaxID=2508722 RepID=A0ABY9RSU5_9ACTN|nr:DUF397 domain-containing protein [Streptomyces roseicoloratus]WMX45267.1 DUF397 domain-containing protein [Streptomyces roseicoloratus]